MTPISRCTNCKEYYLNIPEDLRNDDTCFGRANPPSDCGELIVNLSSFLD